jgi:hypothetical protein
MICNRCNGDKRVKIFETNYIFILEKCRKCNETGYIDWLDEILQIPQSEIYGNSYEYYINNPYTDVDSFCDFKIVSKISAEPLDSVDLSITVNK